MFPLVAARIFAERTNIAIEQHCAGALHALVTTLAGSAGRKQKRHATPSCAAQTG
jgi:hypothetical protein